MEKIELDTQHFRVTAERVERPAGRARDPVWDTCVCKGIDTALCAYERGSHEDHVVSRVYQEAFFETFLVPVPEDAVRFPLHRYATDDVEYILSGCHGYMHKNGAPVAIPVCRVGTQFVACDSTCVAPWLRCLVETHGSDMVFEAWCRANSYLPRHKHSVESVLANHHIRPGTANFFIVRTPPARFAVGLYVEGATISVYENRIGPIECTRRLTPWSRALLARADALTILHQIIDALE